MDNLQSFQVLVIDTDNILSSKLHEFIGAHPDVTLYPLDVALLSKLDVSEITELSEYSFRVCVVNLDAFERQSLLAYIAKLQQTLPYQMRWVVYGKHILPEERALFHKQFQISFCVEEEDIDRGFLFNVLYTVDCDLYIKALANVRSCISIIGMVCSMIEMKESVNKKNHSWRVGAYSYLLARALCCNTQYCDILRSAAKIHDIGVVAIPDFIVQKEGGLSELEAECMKEHTLFGHQLLSKYPDTVFRVGAVIALSHHERYDGSGYPKGLAGDDIPFEARVVAIADVFDGLTRKKTYKPSITTEEALAYLVQNKGVLFDPVFVDAFVTCKDELDRIVHDEYSEN